MWWWLGTAADVGFFGADPEVKYGLGVAVVREVMKQCCVEVLSWAVMKWCMLRC
jgi:hypothetical protein